MNLMSNELFKAVRYALYAGATAAVGMSAVPALAQDAAQDSNSQKLETITVTGSNIRRVDIETSNPVITIDRAAIERTGKLTLGDIIQELPAITGGNTNPQVNNGGGGGSSSIGLRGLGAARTLVLINGQRMIANGPGGADPNSIPANMIERIEVLTDGASSVYGSDAVAGVVNFITRKEYQGAEFSTDYGISDRDDGQRKGYHFSFGQTTDKGSIMGGVDYNKTEAVLASHREFSKQALDITGSPSTPPYTYVGGSSFGQNGNIQLNSTQAAQFGCGRVALNPGASGSAVDTNNYHCFGNSDKYNYAAVNLLLTPQERTSLFLLGTYHLTDNVDVYFDAWHNKQSSSFQLAPALFGSLYGGSISSQSYYNPFGYDFNGSGGNDFRLRLVSAGPRSASNSTSSDQVHTGLKGNFDIGQNNWTWDAGFGYGHVSVNTVTQGLPNVDKLNQAFGPSYNDNGVIRCGVPGAPIANCTPFNPFNQFDPLSTAQIAGVAVPAISSSFSQEKFEHLDVSGGLFDLPAGTIQLAGGVSHRSEYTHSFVDPLLIIDPTTGNCTLGSQCSSALQGGYTVKEAYAELFIPILKDIPFAHALNLTIGDRYSKYSSFGSTNNSKIALEWRPIEDLLLRGTVSKIFRAPTVGNVFASPVSSAPSLGSDPCDYAGNGANPNAGNPACRGVPATGPFQNTDVALGQQIKGIASGSQYAGFPLGPEFGKSFDWGVVYDPSWLPGASISADLWRLYLLNTISGVSAQTVLNLCFAGQTAFCPLIGRDQSGGVNAGQITQIVEPTANLGRSDLQGVDVGLRYRLPELPFGQFTAILNGTYTKQFDVQTAPGQLGNSIYHLAGHAIPFDSAALSACPGNSGVCTMPRWKALAGLNWQLSSFDASWKVRYIGRFRLGSPDLGQDSTSVKGLPGQYIDYGATVYNDFAFGYNIEPLNMRVDVGVDNAFDKTPPQMYFDTNTLNAGTDPSTFDLLGRYYHARLTVKF